MDEDTSSTLAVEGLRNAGAQVEICTEHFPRGTKDHIWLPEVGRRGWAVLSRNKRIRWTPIERQAVVHSKVSKFTLVGTRLTGAEIAKAFVKALPRMKRLLAKYDPPFFAKVYRDGRVVMAEETP